MNIEKLKRTISAIDMPLGPVRISAGHLISALRADGQQTIFSPAMLSVGMYKKDVRRFDAIGGGIALSDKGKYVVENHYQVSDVKYDDHDLNYDARFIVPDEDHAHRVLTWLGDLEMGRRGNFEFDPHREVFGELSGKELKSLGPIIPPEHLDWSAVTYQYLGVCLQPPSDIASDTSVNAGVIPTRRLFHLWQMTVSAEIFSLMQASSAIAFLSPADLRTTRGGRQQGHMADGTPLANNLGLDITVNP